MTTPDKFSEAGKQQLAQHLDFFQKFTSRAFDNAERILALNMAASRATLDQTSGAVRQLAAARDPRDFLALGAQSQKQIEAAMAYSRKLFEITGKPAPAAAPAPAPEAAPEEHIVTAAPVIVSEPVPEPAPEPEHAEEPAPEATVSSVLPSEHPLGEAEPEPEPAPLIVAQTSPIAMAVSAVAAAPVDLPHPAASPLPPDGPVAIPTIAPVDATAPPAAKRSSSAASKGTRKR